MKNKMANKIFITSIVFGIIGIIYFGCQWNFERKLNTQRITSIIQGENEQSNNSEIHSVNMIVNELNKDSGESVSGSKVKITAPEGLSIVVCNISNNSEIVPNENGVVEIPEDGMKLKIDGVEYGETYDINIEQVDVLEDYKSTFKNATIEIDAQNGELISFVKTITTKTDGEDEVQQGSKENTVIFMYEDDGNSNIKIRDNSDVDLYYYISSLNDELSKEELNEIEWDSYNKEDGISLEKNGIVYSKSKYKTGEYSEISKIYITNIDKIEPKIEVTTQTEEEEETSVTIKVQDEENDDYKASGIIGYALTEDEKEPEQFTECENTVNLETQIDGITTNGTYYLWAKDEAGNVSKKEFEITNIKISIVAIILSSPFEELNGTEYENLGSLLEVLNNKDIQERAQIVVQMVHDIKNESVEFENENIDIILDLNGYKIASKQDDKSTFNIKKGKLQVIDSKYKISDYITSETKLEYLESNYNSNTGQIGKIYSENYIAIEIQEGSTFILGEDDEEVSIISPVIEGIEKGIYNNSGEFDFFDGLIIGKSTTEGTITSTPTLYDPTISQTETEGMFQSYLAKVSGIEALIGKTRYTKLETAIEVANKTKGTSEDQIRIDIVTNIILDQTRGTTDENGDIISPGSLIIDESKNILLNLNGFSITNTVTDFVIKNSGSLEIIDSSLDEIEDKATINGKIESTTNDVVYNEGNFKLTSGTIVLNKAGTRSKYKYAINNEGNLNIAEGNVISTEIYTGALSNNGNGTINISGGTINGGAYGIYSNSEGNITIDGGTTTVYSGRAICNKGAGVLTINGGNIVIPNASYAIDNSNGTSSIVINNGNITGGFGIYSPNEAEITINNGTIDVSGNTYASVYGVYSKGKTTINGGIINNKASTGYAVRNYGKDTITINGGTINSKDGGISNSSTGEIIVNDGTINISGSGSGIYNESTGNVTIKGGNIESTSNTAHGVTNKDTGTIIIEKETINIAPTSTSESGGYGIQNVGAGNIIIGKKDGVVNEDINVTVTNNAGVYNVGTGKIYYYDGIIKGKESKKAICGAIEEVEDDTNINLTTDDTFEIANLTELGDIAQVGEIKYKKLKDAVDACNDINKEVIILENFSMTEIDKVIISEKDEVKINLNGKIITTFLRKAIVNNKTLILTDIDDGIGEINSRGNGIIENNGTLTIEKGTLRQELMGTSDNNTNSMIMNYGHLSSIGGNMTSSVSYVTGINNKDPGTIEFIDGTINIQGSIGIDNYSSTGKVEVKGGNIIGYNYGIYNRSTGVVEVTGGLIQNKSSKGYSSGIYNEDNGNVILDGGSIDAIQYGIYNKSTGIVEVNKGDLRSTRYGIYNYDAGNIIVANGKIVGNIGIYNNKAGKIEIKGGTIETTSSDGDGISNYSTGEVIVTGGIITAKNNTGGRGIYNQGTGTVTVGNKDGNVSTTVPYIFGKSYGVYNNKGTFNFYDGKLDGKTNQSIYGTVNDVETEYDIKKYKNGESDVYDVESGREIAILEQIEVFLVHSSNKKYTSLSKALDETQDTDTISLLADTTIIETILPTEIESGKTITLDLAGFKITASNTNTIINNGNLTITDSSTEHAGTLFNTKDTLIKNNEDGVLTLTSGTLSIGEKRNK